MTKLKKMPKIKKIADKPFLAAETVERLKNMGVTDYIEPKRFTFPGKKK